MSSILERFIEVNKTEEQQELLSLISDMRGYKDNTLFNQAYAVQIKRMDILEYILKDTSLYPYCFSASTGKCIVYGKMLIPCVDSMNLVITFLCYDIIAQQLAKIHKDSGSAYFFPETNLLKKKSSFVYAPPNAWDNIIHSDDLYIVDGVWDSVTLNTCGVPAVALLMSQITTEVKQILKLFKRLYIVADNDSAGGLLYKQFLELFSTVYRITVPNEIGKDVDEYGMKKGISYLQSQIRYNQSYKLKI